MQTSWLKQVLLLLGWIITLPCMADMPTAEPLLRKISDLNQIIAEYPKRAATYVRRGDLHYQLNQLQEAVADYSAALILDDTQDQAYFGRGMAYGRLGLVDEGIVDLSVFIARHPNSSLAYTKRGVRNIWRGNWVEAERDLARAVELDPSNAEAHDDLGVVHAQKKNYRTAARHFSRAIELDPGYQKAYHNLAICFHVSGKPDAALDIVNAGLSLDQDNRSSLLLKAAILQALGRQAEARRITEHAEFLPEDNWTERATIGKMQP